MDTATVVSSSSSLCCCTEVATEAGVGAASLFFGCRATLGFCSFFARAAAALEMMNNCGMKGHKETTLTLKNYALCQRRKGNYQEALTYLEKAKRVAEIELENDHKWKVMIDTQLALLYEDLSQTEGAIAIMKNALEMCLRLKLTIDHLGGSRHDIRQFLEYHPEACPENLL